MDAIELTLEQLQAAGALLGAEPGALCAWGPGTSTTRRLTHPGLVNASGELHPPVQAALETLAAPAFLTRLTLLTAEKLLDVAVYQPSQPDAEPTVRLDGREGQLALQSPADLPDLLLDLLTLLNPQGGEAEYWEVNLPLGEALLFWAALDGLRAGEAAELKPETLGKHLAEPMVGLTNLAAYARETLNLTAPARSEVKAGLKGLAEAGLLTEDGQPTEQLAGLAADLFPLGGHLVIESKADEAGEVLTSRMAYLQGPDAAGLLWYEISGQVHLQRVSTAAALAIVEELLFEPWAMFAAG